jgi:hypothetical protein
MSIQSFFEFFSVWHKQDKWFELFVSAYLSLSWIKQTKENKNKKVEKNQFCFNLPNQA